MKNFTNEDMEYIRNLLQNDFYELEQKLEDSDLDKRTSDFKSMKKDFDYVDDLLDRFNSNCDSWIDYSNQSK